MKTFVGLLLLGGLVAVFVWLPDDDAGPVAGGPASRGGSSGVAAAAGDLGSPNGCLPCHAEVVAEWRESMHSQAFTDPQVRAPEQSDNFRKTECLPCHASAPIFAYGIEPGSRVVARESRRHDGIDCLSCHGLPGGGVAATRSGLDAPCQPVYDARLQSEALCAPCHNQHQTHDEWRASPAAERGDDCLSCHMERVTRAGGEAGAPRAGRSHLFLGGRHREFALAGLELSPRLDRDERELVVDVVNAFAGHNLPSDSRNRALDLVVTLYDARGKSRPAIEGLGDRHPGGENGTARLRFRNPYRSSGDPNTQIPAGETRTLRVPLEDSDHRAVVELVYKLSPWVPDTEAKWTERVEVDVGLD